MFGLSALWLGLYALGRLRAAYRAVHRTRADSENQIWILCSIFALLAVLTFANPHVYLDTVILLGVVSIGYPGIEKLVFAGGASLASLCFFATIGFEANGLAANDLKRAGKFWMSALIMAIFAVFYCADQLADRA